MEADSEIYDGWLWFAGNWGDQSLYFMYRKCSASTGTRRLFPGDEAESELANGTTVNATVSGHYVFPSATAVQNLACTGAVGLIAHSVSVVRRNIRVSLYLQHCIHFFPHCNASWDHKKKYFGLHLKGNLTWPTHVVLIMGYLKDILYFFLINIDCTFKPEWLLYTRPAVIFTSSLFC